MHVEEACWHCMSEVKVVGKSLQVEALQTLLDQTQLLNPVDTGVFMQPLAPSDVSDSQL